MGINAPEKWPGYPEKTPGTFSASRTIVAEASSYFADNEQKIVEGQFNDSLIKQIPAAKHLKQIKTISREKYYSAREILAIEIPAYDVLSGLLDEFILAVNDVTEMQAPSEKSKKLVALLPAQFLAKARKPDKDKYQRILEITDFVSGMSDSYAVSLYRLIKGLSLPMR